MEIKYPFLHSALHVLLEVDMNVAPFPHCVLPHIISAHL